VPGPGVSAAGSSSVMASQAFVRDYNMELVLVYFEIPYMTSQPKGIFL
jgi:hypothetical protein